MNWKPDCFPVWFYSVLQKSESFKVAEIFHASVYPSSFFSLCKEVQKRAKHVVPYLCLSRAGLQLPGVWECNQRNYPHACPVFILFRSCLLLEESQVDLWSEPGC